MIRGSDGQRKDTLRNVQATGEFVVNIVSEPLAQAMNISATEFPPEVNEFEAAGLTPAASVKVRPPRVAESKVNFECHLTQVVTLGEGPGSGSVVIGRVVYLHVNDDILLDGDKINLEKLRPIGRLGGHWYTRVTDTFELVRPPAPSARPK
jgi:flavin reductase (DIM6/NTAB) family NADH-FMN oxidoreductase RutF